MSEVPLQTNVWPQYNFYSYIREQGKAVDRNVADSHEVWRW